MPVLDLRRQAAEAALTLPEGWELDDAEREATIGTWLGRMINEHISARVFAGLVPQMMAAEIDASHQASVAEFIGEELRHAVQCASVVHAVGGEPRAQLPALPPVPMHPEVEPLEAFLRNLLSMQLGIVEHRRWVPELRCLLLTSTVGLSHGRRWSGGISRPLARRPIVHPASFVTSGATSYLRPGRSGQCNCIICGLPGSMIFFRPSAFTGRLSIAICATTLLAPPVVSCNDA